MGRRRKMKVRLILKQRNESDSIRFIKAVDDALRPVELEIEQSESDPPESIELPTTPNEQIETEVRSHVGQLLDQQDDQIASQQADTQESSANDPTQAEQSLSRLRSFLRGVRKAGWDVVSRIIATLTADSISGK